MNRKRTEPVEAEDVGISDAELAVAAQAVADAVLVPAPEPKDVEEGPQEHVDSAPVAEQPVAEEVNPEPSVDDYLAGVLHYGPQDEDQRAYELLVKTLKANSLVPKRVIFWPRVAATAKMCRRPGRLLVQAELANNRVLSVEQYFANAPRVVN